MWAESFGMYMKKNLQVNSPRGYSTSGVALGFRVQGLMAMEF